jgi:hypothetical protein
MNYPRARGNYGYTSSFESAQGRPLRTIGSQGLRFITLERVVEEGVVAGGLDPEGNREFSPSVLRILDQF